MIKTVEGDILLSKAHAIAHSVAPNDDFKQGLALSLRERWPAMYKDFRHYCQTQHPKEGEQWTWSGASNTHIICLLAQEAAYEHGSKPGKATTHNLSLVLRALANLVKQENLKSIALPRLATGVGGLQWEDVEPLIQKHLSELDIPIIVYTKYIADKAADEGLS